jgi:integrase
VNPGERWNAPEAVTEPEKAGTMNNKKHILAAARKAGRPRTGAIRRTADGKRWQAIITMQDGSQKRLPRGGFPPTMSEARAREHALVLQEKADALQPVEVAPEEASGAAERQGRRQADQWTETWFKEREARGLTSVRENRSHWETHLADLIGDKHPRDWTRDDLRAVSRGLDAKIQSGMHWKTATNVWNTLTRMCDDATNHKQDDLRCRRDNPATDVRGPDRGDTKSREFLYPAEFLRLVECSEVPLAYRRLVTVAIYTFMRASELQALRWQDVNLDNRTIHVHRALNRRTGATKGTKGRVARRLPMHPHLVPVLETMKREAGEASQVFNLADDMHLAEMLRRHLRTAKAGRESLFTAEATSRRLVFHDLRGTGITWHAVAGTEALKIQQWAGHTDFATTQGYLATADAVGREGFGVPFPELPEGVVSGRSFWQGPATPSISVDATGLETAREHGIEPETPTNAEGEGSKDPDTDGPKSVKVGGPPENQAAPLPEMDPVEADLAKALSLAAQAGEWGVVAELGRQLEVRRRARTTPEVADLDAARQRRER